MNKINEFHIKKLYKSITKYFFEEIYDINKFIYTKNSRF